jgi:hypothetical protein
MGTRSGIGIKNADGTVTAIYCHWDGYPSYNGRILNDHYTDEAKVRELIALGDISSLRPEIGEQHPFDTYHLKESEMDSRWENWCTAYGRDRGETGIEARDFVSKADYFSRFGAGAEYYYLFEDGVWMVQPGYGKATWRPVVDYLNKEEVEA